MKTIANTPMENTHISKSAYLAAVVEWKAKYREVSASQRSLKTDLKAAQRAGNYQAILSCEWGLQKGRKVATALLQERAGMKEAAQAAYLASRENNPSSQMAA